MPSPGQGQTAAWGHPAVEPGQSGTNPKHAPMWAGGGARAQSWPSTRKGALDADGGESSSHGLGGFHQRALRPGPLPASHQPSLSHILWAEASAKVPVVSSPPPHRLWPEPRHCQSLPFGALCPRLPQGRRAGRRGQRPFRRRGLQTTRRKRRSEVRFYLERIFH